MRRNVDIDLIARLITDHPDTIDGCLVEALISGDQTIAVILEQLRRWRERAETLKKKFGYKQSEDELIAIVKSADPTIEEKQPKYVDWIFGLLRPIAGHPQIRIEDEDDLNAVRNALVKYEQYKPIAQQVASSLKKREGMRTQFEIGGETVNMVDPEAVAALNPNINSYRTLNTLIDALDEVDAGLGKAVAQRTMVAAGDWLPGAGPVKESDRFTLVEISDPQTLYNYGEGTWWCTGPIKGSVASAAHYIKEGGGSVFQVWSKKGDYSDIPEAPPEANNKPMPLIQFQNDFSQFMDRRDRPIPNNIWPEDLVELVYPTLEDVKKSPLRVLGMARRQKSRLSAEFEREIAKYPRTAAQYATEILHDRWPEAEESIMADPIATATYANGVLYRKIGEEKTIEILGDALTKIMRNPMAARIISNGFGRWIEAEPTILKDIPQAVEYFKEHRSQFPGTEWAELTEAVAASNNPSAILTYAQNVTRRRIPDKEHILLKDPNVALNYMKTFVYYIKKWPELKQIILHSGRTDWMYKFADISRERLPEETERFLATTPVAPMYYGALIDKFPGRRWEAYEEQLFKKSDPKAVVDYVLKLKERWPEAEPIIAKNIDTAARYAEQVGRFPLGDKYALSQGPETALEYMASAGRSQKKPRWPELEELIKDDADNAIRYAKLTGQRFKGGESAILRNDLGKAMQYMKDWETGFKNDEWPAFRDRALELVEKLPNMIVVYSSITGTPIPPDALEKLRSLRHGLWYQIAQNIAARRT